MADEQAPIAMFSSAHMSVLRIVLGVARHIKDAKEAGEDVRVIIERVSHGS
jgi:hypothetical protein